MLLDNKKLILITLTGLIYLSYFFGFYFNENSIGSGGPNGDLIWIWKNFELFKNNNLIDAIHHIDFFGNRTPLLYIINIYLNPFINNIYFYRLSIFLFSLIGPFIFYLCLKNKFENTEKEILILISSIVLISPFYRTTAYWGMEINYGLITMFIAYYYFQKIRKKNEKNILKVTLLTIFFSSLTIYFDQKLLFVPIIVFFKIMLTKENLKIKIISLFFFILLSLPYIYLIYIWGGIVPAKTQLANPNTITNAARLGKFYIYHLGYASTIIAFYLMPLLILKNGNFLKQINNFFSDKNTYLLLIIPIIYILYIYINLDFKSYTIDNHWVGLGLVHKTSLLLFSDIRVQEIFTYTMFFLSWCLITMYIEKNLNDWLIIIFFFLLSIFIWPLMQEYFDLIITTSAFLIFKTKIKLEYFRSIFFFLYFFVFLISSNLYYLDIK